MGMARQPSRFGVDPGFDAFVREAGPGLLRFAHALTGERAAAEDLFQETVLRVGLAWQRVSTDGNAVGYTRRAMVNTFLSARRHRHPSPAPYDHDVADPRGETGFGRNDDLDDLKHRLDALPAQQRAAIAMRYLLDLPDAQIADVLRCGEGAVRSYISRGLKTLRIDAAVPDGDLR